MAEPRSEESPGRRNPALEDPKLQDPSAVARAQYMSSNFRIWMSSQMTLRLSQLRRCRRYFIALAGGSPSGASSGSTFGVGRAPCLADMPSGWTRPRSARARCKALFGVRFLMVVAICSCAGGLPADQLFSRDPKTPEPAPKAAFRRRRG